MSQPIDAISSRLAEFVRLIERDGWCVVEDVVEPALLDRVVSDVAGRVARAGLRNLLRQSDAARRIADHPAVRALPEALLGPSAAAVRAILFDKTADANWKVPWHQDLSIAVRERRSIDGFGPWSVKDGVVHVEPPVGVLERMLTVRVHIDDCGVDNGPLRVLAGSHRLGRLDPPAIERLRSELPEHTCVARRGAIIAFRPLALHASAPAAAPAHRRVVHLEFACEALPSGLAWAEASAASASEVAGGRLTPGA